MAKDVGLIIVYTVVTLPFFCTSLEAEYTLISDKCNLSSGTMNHFIKRKITLYLYDGNEVGFQILHISLKS